MNAAALIVALFFAGMGLAALISPAFIWAPFGVTPSGPDSRNEVRAVYGGFGLAVAGLLVLTDDSATLRDGVLVAVAVSLFGMAAGRLFSALFEPCALRRWPGAFLVLEVVLGTLCLIAH